MRTAARPACLSLLLLAFVPLGLRPLGAATPSDPHAIIPPPTQEVSRLWEAAAAAPNGDARLDCYSQALTLAERTADASGRMGSLRRRGEELLSLGRTAEAAASFEQMLGISRAQGWVLGRIEGHCFRSIASENDGDAMGHLWKACDLIRAESARSISVVRTTLFRAWEMNERRQSGRALLLAEAARGGLAAAPSDIATAEALQMYAAIVMGQGDLERAYEHQARSVSIMSRPALGVGAGDRAVAKSVLGCICIQAGRLDEAVWVLRDAIRLATEANDGTLTPIEARLNLAQALAQQDSLAEATSLVAEAREQISALPPADSLTRYERGVASLVEGSILLRRGRHSEALTTLRSALEDVRPVGGGGPDEAEVLRMLWDACRAAGRGAEQLEVAERLWKLRREILGKLIGAEDMLEFEARFPDDDLRLMLSRLGAGDVTGAYLVLEEGRAASFRASLRHGVRSTAFSANSEAAVRVRQAIADVRTAFSRLEAKPNSAAAEAGLRDAKIRLRAARDRFYGGTESYPTQSPGLAELRAALSPGDMFLAYEVGEKETVVFALDSQMDAPKAVRIPIGRAAWRSSVTQSLREIRDYISRPRGTAVAARSGSGSATLRRLADQLFPVSLRSRVGAARHLLLGLDEDLYAVPINALPLPPGCGRRSGRRLGGAIPVSQIPSLTAALAMKSIDPTGGPSTVRSLIVGNPTVGGGTDQTGRSPKSASHAVLAQRGRQVNGVLPSLPHTEPEAREVAATWASRPLLGRQATSSAVHSRLPSADLVHLASHGRAGGSIGQVYLASQPGVRSARYGTLGALDFLLDDTLRLKAKLVVLSACSTGVGRAVSGEGLIGLPRSFQIAGAGAVVCSLWDVDDAATRRLMVAFHHGVRRGLDYDVALQQAMRQMESTGADPYLWAGFTVMGGRNNRLVRAAR